jgi:hypothetical protein
MGCESVSVPNSYLTDRARYLNPAGCDNGDWNTCTGELVRGSLRNSNHGRCRGLHRGHDPVADGRRAASDRRIHLFAWFRPAPASGRPAYVN